MSKSYVISGAKIHTMLKEAELIHSPIFNKGTFFSEGERKTFHLEGLLPLLSVVLNNIFRGLINT